MHKGTNFTSVVVHTDTSASTTHNVLYLVGSDRMIKEVQGGAQGGELTHRRPPRNPRGQSARSKAGEDAGRIASQPLSSGIDERKGEDEFG